MKTREAAAGGGNIGPGWGVDDMSRCTACAGRLECG